MRFEAVKSESAFYSQPTWLVEKILTPGERYLIASFHHEDQASACLESLRPSIEVRDGAQIHREVPCNRHTEREP